MADTSILLRPSLPTKISYRPNRKFRFIPIFSIQRITGMVLVTTVLIPKDW
jgi:hypothetical protein